MDAPALVPRLDRFPEAGRRAVVGDAHNLDAGFPRRQHVECVGDRHADVVLIVECCTGQMDVRVPSPPCRAG